MKWALVWLFWLFLVKNSQAFDSGGGNDDCDISHTYCSEQNTYHDHECTEVCHHEKFEEFLKDAPKIGKFKKCCDKYSFENNCEEVGKGVWNHRDNSPRLCGAKGNVTHFQNLRLLSIVMVERAKRAKPFSILG